MLCITRTAKNKTNLKLGPTLNKVHEFYDELKAITETYAIVKDEHEFGKF